MTACPRGDGRLTPLPLARRGAGGEGRYSASQAFKIFLNTVSNCSDTSLLVKRTAR